MEAEIAREVGAEHGEVSAGAGGAPQRVPAAAVGDAGRRDRAGDPASCGRAAYFPSFLEPRRRSEQAIVAVVQEAYVNGVSTRKVDRLVEQLGIRRDGQGPRLRAVPALDEQVTLFRERPLEGALPVSVAGRQE